MVSVRRHKGDWGQFRAAARVGLALSAFVLVQTGNPAHQRSEAAANSDRHTNHQQTHTPPRSPPINLHVTLTDQRHPEATADQHNGEELPHVTDLILAGAALASLLFSFLLWRSTDKLWIETRRLAVGADDQHGTLKESVRVAEKAANAATEAARVAINVELPTLGLTDISLALPDGASFKDGMRFLRFNLGVKNYGRTPAFLTHVIANVFVGNLPERPTWPNYFDLNGPEVIEAKAAYKFETTKHRQGLDPIALESLLQGGGPVWIYWMIVYRDFLGRRNVYQDARQLVVANPIGIHYFVDDAPEAYKVSGHIIEESHKDKSH